MADPLLELPPPLQPVTRIRRDRFVQAMRNRRRREIEIARYLHQYEADAAQMDARLRLGAEIARNAEDWSVGVLNEVIRRFEELKARRLDQNAMSLESLEAMLAAVEELYAHRPSELLQIMRMHRLTLQIDSSTMRSLGQKLTEIVLGKLQEQPIIDHPAAQRMVLAYADMALGEAVMAAVEAEAGADPSWRENLRQRLDRVDQRMDRFDEWLGAGVPEQEGPSAPLTLTEVAARIARWSLSVITLTRTVGELRSENRLLREDLDRLTRTVDRLTGQLQNLPETLTYRVRSEVRDEYDRRVKDGGSPTPPISPLKSN